ncbi:hypothetical protein [Salinispora arenicola]|uniref:hypothetical protein n=1 Tax=Salinispora arenicola TaxID=168697 RepID=UPI00035D684E|nr:hypothetical protein [Salinispora arenicola]
MSAAFDLTAAAQAVFDQFYRVPRAGAVRLSDGGGPFGFDITVAMQVEHLVTVFDCDGIVETGCYLGDTTDYLARRYPHLPVRTCDIDSDAAAFTRRRLRHRDNVQVLTGDSATVISRLGDGLTRPLYYLDAHWYPGWPLPTELAAINVGVVCVDDIDIGHPRFGFDTYDGRPCDPHLIAEARPDLTRMWVGNPYFDYPLPCLQTGRRAGTGYLLPEHAATITHPMFTPVPLNPVRLPSWPATPPDRSTPA